jgi:hypothetical protein
MPLPYNVRSDLAAIFRRVELRMWVISSVGRASALHAEGRRFEPVITHQLLIKIRHLAVSFFWPKFLGLTLDLLWTCVLPK